MYIEKLVKNQNFELYVHITHVRVIWTYSVHIKNSFYTTTDTMLIIHMRIWNTQLLLAHRKQSIIDTSCVLKSEK